MILKIYGELGQTGQGKAELYSNFDWVMLLYLPLQQTRQNANAFTNRNGIIGTAR